MKKLFLISVAILGVMILGLGLREVFVGRWVLGQGFALGPLFVRYYGLCMALAVAAGWRLLVSRAQNFGLAAKDLENFLLALVVGGFLGARLYHIASDWQYYWQQPQEILLIWHGGLSIFGALLGGLVAVGLFAPARLSRLQWLDLLAPSLALGQAIGRLGNLFNYEAFGYPTRLPWKMFVPLDFRPSAYQAAAFFHPFFLYEGLFNLGICLLLLWLSKKYSGLSGSVFFSYLLVYGLVRFVLEFLRADSTFIWQDLRLNTVASFALVLAGTIGLLYKSMKKANSA